MNEPLQRRAGANIGVSPLGDAMSAYQQYVDAPVLTLDNEETVLWQSAPGGVRAPGGALPIFPAMLLSKVLPIPGGDVDLEVYFIDGDGDEFFLGDGIVDGVTGVGFLLLDGLVDKIGGVPLGLCPNAGEKIVARVDGGTPNGNVLVIPYSKDLKQKSSGKGGLSDGGVVCIRGVVDENGFTFGPRPGTTWEPLQAIFGQMSLGGGGFLSLFLGNRAAAGSALLQIYLVMPDGTEIAIPHNDLAGFPLEVPAGFLIDVASYLGNGIPPSDFWRSYIQYPTRFRVKYAAGNQSPVGSVKAFALFGENDVAADLVQEES